MPQKIEAVAFVDDPARTLDELQTACREAGLDTSGTVEMLRERLKQYLLGFTDADEIVCLNPER